MLMLVRGENDSYTCETSFCDIAEAVASPKAIPANWINEDKISLSFQFNKYALPLIQGEAEVAIENTSALWPETNDRLSSLVDAYSVGA